ncbi:ATP-binding cassette domain-containing protein [Candidatus Saccharibacteria bacterium]|nr:ATP-binding cassette domain-containing protein [Candidatus Saccharibacteria bacterium]
MPNEKRSLIEVKQVHKSFWVKGGKVPVLRGVDMTVGAKDFLIIYGPSGCGKSTLLHTVLGLERPSGGRIFLFRKDLYQLTSDERADLRRTKIGMLYQQSNWIKTLDVQDNVALPLNLLGLAEEEARKKALGVLEQVGLADWKDYVPTELSAGQQQRVGLARALVSDPEILIVDEPTGNLDSKSGLALMNLLKLLSQNRGKTVIMVTHDLRLLVFANRVIEMSDGRVVKEHRGGKISTIRKATKR